VRQKPEAVTAGSAGQHTQMQGGPRPDLSKSSAQPLAPHAIRMNSGQLAVGVIASFWVWIAAVMGVYWERKAGPAAVAKMEQLSAGAGSS